MCVMIYLKNSSFRNEFEMSETMTSAEYIGIVRSLEHAPEIIEIKALISDIESGNSSKLNNVSTDNLQNHSKEKLHTLDCLKARGVENVISMTYTLSALKVFKRYGFNTYKAVNGQWEDNLACYFNGELKFYDYSKDHSGQGCMSKVGSC